MKQSEVNNLALKIQADYQLFAPVKIDQEPFVQKIENIREIDYSGKIPANSWKQLFLPAEECLGEFKGPPLPLDKLGATADFTEENYPKVCAYNMTILDLKALGLYDLVFVDDPYYQARRRQILAVGLLSGAPSKENFSQWKLFGLEFEENFLEHLPFDIFLQKSASGDYKIYAGSGKGQEILEQYGIKDYDNVQFSGLIPEQGKDKRMLKLQEVVKNSKNHPLWDELDKICLACGKCSLVCPTCFCFDFEDEASEQSVARKRVWGNCFYPGFTAIAGGADYTDTVKKKLQFWYEHKFVRIPAQYQVPGCVACNRCTAVCPVGIDIVKNLKKLEAEALASA